MMNLLFIMLFISSFNVNGVRGTDRFEKVVQMCNADILCLQETHWDGNKAAECQKKWPGHFFINNCNDNFCGVAILMKNYAVKDAQLLYSDHKGRVIQVEFTYNEVKYDVMNVYAPNNEVEREALFRGLAPRITERTMIMGDFHVKLSRLDVSDTNTFKSDRSRVALLELLEKCDLCDVWRQKNPTMRDYSRVQKVLGKLNQSRIDLCLVKNGLINYIQTIQYKLNALSDHAILRFGLGKTAGGRSGGLWCLNSSLLKNEAYRKLILKLVRSEVSKASFAVDVIGGWESLKSLIKYKTINFAKKLNLQTKSIEQELRLKIVELNADGNAHVERISRLQAELADIDLKRCEGAIVRSRAQYAVEGERSTAFFLGLEKVKQEKCYLESLENKDGQVVTDLVDIAATVQSFYADLFSKDACDSSVTEQILSKIGAKLTEAESAGCDQDILLSDIEAAVNSMQSNKSPGSDGLTSDFYKVFLVDLAPILLRVFREMERKQQVPESMTMGIIPLVFKKGKKESLENYRPISLLNTDYKILMKILANRFKEVLASIIEPTQAYSVPGREVSDTVRTISDVIEWMKTDGQGGIVLSLDFNKAFDRVEHHFLFKVLGRMGFGARMLTWVKLLYGSAKSRVKVNGLLTDPFRLERSVRQGCPLSSILYSIVAEPLAAPLKQNKQIKGIELPGGGVSVVQQFADDTTITVRDMDSIKKVIEIVDYYGRASGARLNMTKSEVMFIGTTVPNQDQIPFKIKEDHMKVLGVYVEIDSPKARDLLWSEMMSKMQRCLNFWKLRESLSFQGYNLIPLGQHHFHERHLFMKT